MFQSLLTWFGFGHEHPPADGHAHEHGDGSRGHGHTHGVVDPRTATTERGIWAIKWSFGLLALTAAMQLVVVYFSGSVALLADTIHNIGDAGTAIPLWIAFILARRKPSPQFTYGYGRVEDLAGVAIVFIILASAIVAGWEAIDRLIHPQPITLLGWVAVAGVIGFLGNEAVAVFRIRVGREIDSAALIADGYHARVDGLTSVAVVVGVAGVWLGYPIADPIVGLIITAMIFGIVWQSAKAVFTRMLDGIEPRIGDELRHAAAHVAGVWNVNAVRARWVGHRLRAEITVALDPALTIAEASKVVAALKKEATHHLPTLDVLHVETLPGSANQSRHEQPQAKAEHRH